MWSTEATVQLIELLESKPILWNVKCEEYRDKEKKADAIKDIANNLSKEVYDVEKKIRSLRVQFNREHQKLVAIQEKGGLTNKRILWFGYNLMKFLVEGSRSRRSRTTTDVTTVTELDAVEENVDIVDQESHSASECDQSTVRTSILESALKKKSPVLKKQHFKNAKSKKLLFSPVNPVKIPHERLNSRDKYEIFGESVAISLRESGRNSREISIAKHKINQVLFDLEMGYYAHEVEHRPASPNGELSPIVLMTTE
ncbi:hypothetical protein CHUAL_007364 [Chamberlinius hualienensis]